jgi:CBS domain-containing protein
MAFHPAPRAAGLAQKVRFLAPGPSRGAADRPSARPLDAKGNAMTAGERMTRSFEVVHPDVPLDHAIPRLAADGHRPLLVCEHGRLIGVLDLETIRSGRRKRGANEHPLRVRDAVAPDVLYCLESTDLAEAAALMREHRALAIPVVDAEQRLVGVVALEDVPIEAQPPAVGGPADRGAAGR